MEAGVEGQNCLGRVLQSSTGNRQGDSRHPGATALTLLTLDDILSPLEVLNPTHGNEETEERRWAVNCRSIDPVVWMSPLANF